MALYLCIDRFFNREIIGYSTGRHKDAELVQDQLGACHKTIMNFKIVTHRERPLFDINYPKGYER